SGRELKTFQGHSDAVLSVAFSPDGRTALSGSGDKTLKLWDVASGRELKTFQGHSDAVLSVAFSPDGRSALSGSDDSTLKLWDVASGRELKTLQGHSSGVWSVAFSPDGRTALSGSYDGTVRAWNLERGQELAALAASPDGEWLAFTPRGFFTASDQGVDKLLHVVRGFDVFSVMQFYEKLSRSDLVSELLKGDPEGKYADTAFKLNLETILDSGPAPQIELLEKKTEQSDDSVKLAVRIKDMGGGIGSKVVWRVNGKTQGDLTTPGLQGLPTIGRAVIMNQGLKVDPGKSNTIEVTAYNGEDLLASVPFRMTVDPFGVTTHERPKLYVLSIGVENYAMKDYKLEYAAKDARAFAEAMKTVGSSLFSEVSATLILNEHVTKPEIEAAIAKLAGEVKPNDVFVMFLGGHGKSIAGRYYFVQQDLNFSKGQTIVRDGISQDLWQAWLAKIAAEKSLLIFDTCESEGAKVFVRGGERERQTAMEQLEHATGQNLIAAAREAAYEGYRDHGVLTYTILEAFQKLGTAGADDKVDVNSLARHVGERVPEITASLYSVRQEPIQKLSGSNFPLGLRTLAPPPPSECPEGQDFIIIRNERLREEPKDAAGGDRMLDPGYKVGAKFIGSWALICRDNAKLGYVPQDALLKEN
ncbi:MAG: caspase family protein, partial [Rhodomicrobium sp.]